MNSTRANETRSVPVERAHPARLIAECKARHLPWLGDRDERIDRLKEAGIHHVYPDLPVYEFPPPPANPPSDPTCVCVGAIPKRMQRHAFSIANATHPDRPLLAGNFRDKTVTIDRVLRLTHSPDLRPDTPGSDGDLRRKGSDLYMFRSLGARSGWYRLAFDHVLM